MNSAAVWVVSEPGLPCGARPLGDSLLGPAPSGRVWLDVCMLGQHLPQMYRQDEVRGLAAGRCERLGLCPDCLGFGDMSRAPVTEVLLAARGIDQVERPCPNCGGTGRPAVRITVRRDAPGATASIRPLPHEYVPPLDLSALCGIPDGMCLACGMAKDGTGPRGEVLHQ